MISEVNDKPICRDKLVHQDTTLLLADRAIASHGRSEGGASICFFIAKVVDSECPNSEVIYIMPVVVIREPQIHLTRAY